MKNDSLEEKILEILTVDARISNREVGRLLNVSDVTIGKRLKAMQRSGAIRITALVNPQALGLNCAAFVRLKTAPEMARKIAMSAAALKEVPFVSLTGGPHNVVTLAVVEDRQALADLVHQHFRRWKGIYSLETHELISSPKHRLDVVRIVDQDQKRPAA
ncbi:Lrp/AsnC family transcriptional regulator [Hyphomonas sp.]|uniref:Lrp/AsnC family transcriptional regulator n=1 Tax=Hyphomonas sp. TaxID=87 RepID=UPI0025C4F3A7|nr:Lrp/AsnC family transcriptional regulator [Hyphomonas sp.]